MIVCTVHAVAVRPYTMNIHYAYENHWENRNEKLPNRSRHKTIGG